ncbi:antA/AntB antirepressor family protein [Lactococcus garvieae]|uniref:antA/AntB antirepressor family protein n=1 Tax=Lactococcus garvieae TaxID=1363 RepID=UPI0030CC346B
MNQLINITQNENNDSVVSGRELYDFLEVSERYSTWFERMTKYGFEENIDFVGCKVFNTLAKQELQDHALKLDMAKEISMIQRTAKGKEARQYFIQVEKEYKQQQQVPLTLDQQIAAIATGYGSMKEEFIEVKDRVTDLEENAPLSPGDYSFLGRRINQRVNEIARSYGGVTREQRSKLYVDINQGVKAVTGTQTRTQLRIKHFDTALEFINDWEPSTATKMQIKQTAFDFGIA